MTEAKLYYRWKQRERGAAHVETIIHRNGVRLAKAKVEAPGVDVFPRETFRETSIPYEMAD